MNRNDEFSGWDAWKEYNKKGFDATVSFEISENKVTVRTENQGIGIRAFKLPGHCVCGAHRRPGRYHGYKDTLSGRMIS